MIGPVNFHLFNSSKILITALFVRIFLRKHINTSQWTSLLMLFVGVLVTQQSEIYSKVWLGFQMGACGIRLRSLFHRPRFIAQNFIAHAFQGNAEYNGGRERSSCQGARISDVLKWTKALRSNGPTFYSRPRLSRIAKRGALQIPTCQHFSLQPLFLKVCMFMFLILLYSTTVLHLVLSVFFVHFASWILSFSYFHLHLEVRVGCEDGIFFFHQTVNPPLRYWSTLDYRWHSFLNPREWTSIQAPVDNFLSFSLQFSYRRRCTSFWTVFLGGRGWTSIQAWGTRPLDQDGVS